MISVVVVSHSRVLAQAAVALAGEMVSGDEGPRVAVAAGLDEATFGTDATAVAEAITEVDSPDGVLVLLDLGSALLSAEMALELLDPDVAGRVRLSSAPLVEGLVAAVVAASTGSSIDVVAAEAEAGLLGKREHLGAVDAAEPGRVDAPVPDEDAESVEIEVANPHGLHARPAARLVGLVGEFAARVALTNATTGRGPVNAASLSQIATLDARQGSRLVATASGAQAREALDAIAKLAADRFGEDAGSAAADEPAGALMSGSGLDIAIGPALVARGAVDTGGYAAGTPSDESERSADALRQAADRLDKLQRHTASTAGSGEAEIFSAQKAMLTDPEITTAVADAIEGGASAVEAWRQQLDVVAKQYSALSEHYLRERAIDVTSVRDLVLRSLLGQTEPLVDGEGILVVPELDAATAAFLDAASIVGIVTVRGGATGHGVLVARSRGIPVLTDAGDEAEAVEPGTVVAFDAAVRRLVVDCDAEQQQGFRAEIERRQARRDAAATHGREPALTRDGRRVSVLANVASLGEAVAAQRFGAEGSGLVRTEILFGEHTSAPSVEQQVQAYRELADALGGSPLTIRAFDVGGDKPVAFLPSPHEANPFLGERGLRLLRREPQVLRDQLAAVCLTARETPVKVMFPMVTTVDEVDWARAMLLEAAAGSTGDVPGGLGVGIMVEVPAAALRVRSLAARLDFVSIGTNDLTQYTVAAERGNAAVSPLADAFDPAVLALIHRVVSDVGEKVDVAVCGDLASDVDGAVLLVGLGVVELSVVGPQVPIVKQRLREVRLDDARLLAEQALQASGPSAVRQAVAAAYSHPAGSRDESVH